MAGTVPLRREHDEELPGGRFDAVLKIKTRFEARDAVDEPGSGLVRVFVGGAASHRFTAAFGYETLDACQDHPGVNDEKLVRPGDDRFNVALAGVAVAMGETFGHGAALLLGLLAGGASIDARTARVVDRDVRVHWLVAQPASPAVCFADLVKGAHLATLQQLEDVASSADWLPGETSFEIQQHETSTSEQRGHEK